METELARSWAMERPVTSPFARPNGIRGRLAGRIMLWTNPQHVVLDNLEVRPGDRVLEVGYGPGGLVRLLVERTDAVLIQGIDPSPDMRDVATRVNRAAAGEGRVDLRVGTAERTGLPDQSVDHVVSVNNVAIWPDLEAGLQEFHRVVRPGGTVVIAWHGGTDPSRIARSLRLPKDKLDRIEHGLEKLFSQVTRRQSKNLDIFRSR
ncbi:methyltransferase domain-containing protein [Actinopolymorpha sp. B9G3]|uniref:class I SAM-dependent methyltransferase n=1 Tax=Actinopolymorpha sp. B9G3 TaxID=3158970 RepID=UPI0032D932FB